MTANSQQDLTNGARDNVDTPQDTAVPDAPHDEPSHDATNQEPDTADHHLAKLRKEAAKYRTRLRDAETRLEQANATRAGLHRTIIDLVNPHAESIGTDALIKLGLDISDHVRDDGSLDVDGVRSAIDGVIEASGIRFRGAGLPYVESVGRVSTGTPRPDNWIKRGLYG